MEKNRRKFLLGTGVVAGGLGLSGYSETLSHALFAKDKGEKNKDSLYGDAPNPEAFFKDGELVIDKNFNVLPSVCNGCTTQCGIRVKIDTSTNKVVRTFGNPYSPLSSNPWLNGNTPLLDSFKNTSAKEDLGIDFRSTVCARGNLVYEKLDDRFRVTSPLKRVGKRGENKWKKISIEELIDEIVNGGNLFGEGELKGLKDIADTKTPIDENNKDYGPLANKLCVLGTTNEGRQNFAVHRFVNGFGSANYMGHTATCGLSMRAGNAAYLNDLSKYPHLKPDFEHCKFLLNIGTAPAQAGNPFKRQAKLLSEARVNNNMQYVTITPNLTNADTIAIGGSSKWIPIKPGSDLAFVMGMIREIIESKSYNEAYLKIPSLNAQIKLKDYSHTNASHLVIVDEGEHFGKFLQDNGLPQVMQKGRLIKADDALEGDIYFSGRVALNGKSFNVKSSFILLKENAFLFSLEEYAKQCDVSSKQIRQVAKQWTSYGRSVGSDCHGGTMHTTGFYTTYAIMMLGALVGNLNYKGGMSIGGGKFKDYDGAKYNLLAYEGKNKPQGTRIDRARRAYEDSTEFKQNLKKGKPYPAKDNWYPLTNALITEFLANSANSYPYKLDVLISWNSNFVYAQSGHAHLIEALKDPKKAAPLFVAIDPFINETSIYADYIVPDSVLFETWGVVNPWSGYNTKASQLRFPIIESKNDKFSNGENICMDSFFIELGKKLGLKAFGKNAIKDKNGNFYPLDRPSDFYLRAFENIALDGDTPEISDLELESLKHLESLIATLKQTCGDNWRKVAFILSRGGKFAPQKSAYNGEGLSNAYKKTIAIYNEKVGTTRNALSGERYSGTPKFYESRYCNGEALRMDEEFNFLAFSYKSNVLSSATASVETLRDIRYTSYIDINPKSAKKYGIENGSLVKLSSKDFSIEGFARLREGVHPNSIGVEHGTSRRGEGGKDVEIDGEIMQKSLIRASGVNLNDIGIHDKTRHKYATLGDFAIGSNARQAFPVKIEKM